MRKFLYTVIFLLFSLNNVNSQDIPEQKDNMTAEEKFTASDIQEKLKILSAVKPSEETFDLYKKAVEYAALNNAFYENDPFFDEIYVKAVSGVLSVLNSSSKVRKKSSTSSIYELLKLVEDKPDPVLFPHLYRMKNMKYPDDIREKAENIFYSSSIPFYSTASNIIVNNPVQDKLEILTQVLENPSMSLMEKGELSSKAMEAAFSYHVSDHRETEAVKNLLIMCVDVIHDLEWSEASSLVLRYFDILIAYENIDAVRDNLKKTIKTLGILGTHEAAVRLSMYIGLINSFAEKGLEYDEEILKEVILSLGNIGDLAAYENLSNMEKLGYSEEIISLSEKALSNLKISR